MAKPRAATVLARMRRICLALPDTKETLTWGEPHFRVGEKIFAGCGLEKGKLSIGFKLEMDHADLVVQDPRFSRAPYVGHKGWVSMDAAGIRDWEEVRALVLESYRLIAPKKLLAKLALGILVLSTPAAAQSLGDAARKERERRDKIERTGAPSPTVTDADLATHRGTLANDPEAAPAPAAGEDAQASDREDPPIPIGFRLLEAPETMRAGGGEEYWRGRVAEARGRIEDAQRRHDSLQRQILFGQPVRYNENGQRVIYSIHQMKAKADAAEAELRAAEAALEDLFAEARRAGALPGWLR